MRDLEVVLFTVKKALQLYGKHGMLGFAQGLAISMELHPFGEKHIAPLQALCRLQIAVTIELLASCPSKVFNQVKDYPCMIRRTPDLQITHSYRVVLTSANLRLQIYFGCG